MMMRNSYVLKIISLVCLASPAFSDGLVDSGGDLVATPAPVVCIDPGHPSETSAGTVSRDGTLTERHMDWIVALRLQKLLVGAKIRVVMTKSSEFETVTNRRRAEIANAAGAILFLRLHCDSAPTQGIAFYYPDRQGRAHGVTGPSADVLASSRRAAAIVHDGAMPVLVGQLRDRGVHGESATLIGARQGALTGSIFSRVPAVTVEMVVLTDEHDFALARTAVGQEALAQALFAGVMAWVPKAHGPSLAPPPKKPNAGWSTGAS